MNLCLLKEIEYIQPFQFEKKILNKNYQLK
jgi:hypothetical protein